MTKRVLTMDSNGNQSWEDAPLFAKDINVPNGIAGVDGTGTMSAKTRIILSKIIKNKTDFATPGMVRQITLISLPPGGELLSITAECTEAWNGGATVTMSVGRVQSPIDFLIAQDVKTPGFKDLLGSILTTKRGMFSSTQPVAIIAEAKSTIVNLDQSTTGSITFYITYIAH